MNKQQLASKIWESANQMRSKIEANEYKDYILGFIFYKYLSDAEEKFLSKEGYAEENKKELVEENEETMNYIRDNIGYFISYQHLFSTWISKGSDFNVSDVTDALSSFARLLGSTHKKVFEGIFHTLETGLSKLGESPAARTKAIRELIYLIKDIPMDGKQDYDVLGFIYEYLIGKFAANAGKKAGEFYTPHEVSLVMSEIVADHLKDKKEIEIYDPTSGSGSLLINIGHSVAKHMDNKDNIKFYAQELKQNTYNLTRMNLVMRGIKADNVFTRNGDTLEDDWPYFDENDPANSYNPLYVDAVVSNPPYSQKWDPENKETDPRYARFGLAPKSKADYAFLLHDLYHIKPDGIMTIVLPHGVLFRGGEEGKIRKNLFEGNHIDAIIGLPANIFFGTGIPTVILVLKQKRDNTDLLIIDASKGFEKVGKNNKLRASDIKLIADTVIGRKEIQKYSKVVSREEVRKNDYNLNIPRYVDSSDKTESWDIYASMFGGIPDKELDDLCKYWDAFPRLRDYLFESNSSKYSSLKVDDVKKSIREYKEVIAFKNQFNSAFSDFPKVLRNELLTNMDDIKISQEEIKLSDEIFHRLENIPLIDPYEAYQILDDEWISITGDLEILQTEGFESAKIVDPNMVLKKKKGKEQEVQEGWKGHIIPFDLLQKSLLKKEYNLLNDKENRLQEILSEVEAILDSLSEEDKESEAVNEAKDGFITKVVSKLAKQYKAEVKKNGPFDEETIEDSIIKVSDLLAEAKTLKSKIKSESVEVHIKTKETIESLSDEQVLELLEAKWIAPLISKLDKLPEVIVDELASEVEKLADKYATTYSEVEEQIHETESELSALIDELVGDEYDMKGLSEFQSLLKGE